MKWIKNKKGQMLIFFGLAFTFLFLLFAMVVNISFIVTAKINLQNAVDLAAYAGAAQQARYMTALGIWNYEMRRNFKVFTYDNNVMMGVEFLVGSQ
jgi:Flp pilus assembly protein TadG